MKIAIVIPTYNERENVAGLLERIALSGRSLQDAELYILFVDDGSPDGTASEVKRLAALHRNIHLLERHDKGGIGSAYLDGFRWAVSQTDASVFVQMDADLQHPPEKVAELLRALEKADIALASRYVSGGGTEGWNWRRKLVSKTANWLARTLLGLDVKDLTTGFKALNRRSVDVLLGQRLSASGFTYQVESVYLLRKAGLAVREVPFVFNERVRGESKLSSSEIFEFVFKLIALRLR